MKPLKFTLIGLVVLLAVAVAYGYGCGGSDDTSGGGEASTAVESNDTSSSAESTDSGDSTDGGGDGDETNGNNGSDGDGDAASATKAVFIKEGDELCQQIPQRFQKNLKELERVRKIENEPKLTPAEVNIRAAVPPLYSAIEEFADLEPPAEDKQKVAAMMDALEAAAKGVEAKPTSKLSGPKSPFAEFQKLANAYGFKVCNQL